MAPNKFEKHIKKQLESRDIEPSAAAWEKLSNKLDTRPRSRKKGYLWYAIAACFIGLLIVSVVYLNLSSSLETQDIQLVDSPEKTNTINAPNEEVIIALPIEDQIVENESGFAVIENVAADNDVDIEVNYKKEQVVSNKLINQEVKEDKVSLFEDGFVESKIQEVIAQVDALEENNISLTDVEVDSLLRKAQEEILRDKLFNQNGSVDAMALLTEVEGELDETFRDQIFESLKTGFLKVRTAVADRNN